MILTKIGVNRMKEVRKRKWQHVCMTWGSDGYRVGVLNKIGFDEDSGLFVDIDGEEIFTNGIEARFTFTDNKRITI